MSKTIAQHSAAYRARRSARIKRMEAALREIARLPYDPIGPMPIACFNEVRTIALTALSPPPNEREP